MEFPDNSHASRENAEKAAPAEKKIEKVVVGTVIQRKKPLGRRFKDLMIGGDSHSVGRYILMDILVPAVKDTIADIVSQGIERMMFGEAKSSSRRTGQRPSGNSSQTYVNYSRFSSQGGRRDEPRRPMTQKARAAFDFEEIIPQTRSEAEAVISQMFDIINQYESVTVADLYSLVGITPAFTDHKWGWTDIRGAGVQRVSNGYLIDLPRPEPLD